MPSALHLATNKPADRVAAPRVPRSATVVAWPVGRADSSCDSLPDTAALDAALRAPARAWAWPSRPVCFVADPHADAEAFVDSLQAGGGIERDPSDPLAFRLNALGRSTEYVIGGDCLDKGPSNLALLRVLRRLIDSGARVRLLAGNHDLRLLMGLQAMERDADPTTEHLFLRMGPKVVPLLREVFDAYLADSDALDGVPDTDACRRLLYPSADWFAAFPAAVAGRLSAAVIERELIRMRRKVDEFESVCRRAGLSLRQVYAAACASRALFLDDDGEFSWFFRDMQLMARRGSFLFVHAGIDDGVAELIADVGVHGVNRRFRELVDSDLFEFYYGTLGNCLRTKYRGVDLPLTGRGVARMHRLGVHAVVHGHRNRTGGQRLVLRQGMMHVESDVTLDRNSRRLEGLAGIGAGVTLIHPDGYVDGISVDYPDIKRFQPGGYRQFDQQRTHAA